VPRAVETGCRGGQVSPRAIVSRAVETGCRGGQVSPRAIVLSGGKKLYHIWAYYLNVTSVSVNHDNLLSTPWKTFGT
jgi:hypothetical protein